MLSNVLIKSLKKNLFNTIFFLVGLKVVMSECLNLFKLSNEMKPHRSNEMCIVLNVCSTFLSMPAEM